MNAAAPAVRNMYSTTWLDFDLPRSAFQRSPARSPSSDPDSHSDSRRASTAQHASAGKYLDLNVGGAWQLGPGWACRPSGDLEQFSAVDDLLGSHP